MTTESVPGGEVADLTSLDGAFYLADHITDQNLRNLYEVLVARMRAEAKGLPMNTVQQLLIERIAHNYITLRAKEGIPVGDDGGFAHSSALKDFNTFWLSMTSEFNKALAKPADDKKVRAALLEEVKRIVLNTVQSLPDAETRNTLIEKFVDAFNEG